VRDRMILGESNKEIARYLGISPRTTEIHRSRVLEKYGVRNAVGLVRAALILGDIELQIPTKCACSISLIVNPST
jgi:DNA-binding CsgD family transcriptional regulator